MDLWQSATLHLSKFMQTMEEFCGCWYLFDISLLFVLLTIAACGATVIWCPCFVVPSTYSTGSPLSHVGFLDISYLPLHIAGHVLIVGKCWLDACWHRIGIRPAITCCMSSTSGKLCCRFGRYFVDVICQCKASVYLAMTSFLMGFGLCISCICIVCSLLFFSRFMKLYYPACSPILFPVCLWLLCGTERCVNATQIAQIRACWTVTMQWCFVFAAQSTTHFSSVD